MLKLVLIGAKEIDVGGNLVDLNHLHPSLDAAKKRVLLVTVEIVASLVSQDVGNTGQ
jgi:hypothetical protein